MSDSRLNEDKPEDDVYTAQLLLAAQNGDLFVIKMLLDGKMDVMDDLVIQATKNNHPEIVAYLLVKKKGELDKEFSNKWEQRHALYKKEMQFVNEININAILLLQKNPDKYFEVINNIHTDRARIHYLENMLNNMTKDDANFIINNLPKLIGCFRSSDEFIYILEQAASKNPEVKFKISESIDNYHIDVNHLVGYLYQNKSTDADNIKLTSKDIDILLSNRRAFIGAINLLSMPEPRMSIILQLSDKLHNVIHDRYDWFNFIAGCNNSENASRMVELIDLIFEKNPALATKFSAKVIKNLIISAQAEVDQHISSLGDEDSNKIDKVYYRAEFARGLTKRMFSSEANQDYIIEVDYKEKNLEKNAAHTRRKKVMRSQSTLIKPAIKNTNKDEAEWNAEERLFQLVDMGRDYRNYNITFISHGGWQQQRYGNPMPFVDRNHDDLVEDVLSRLEGYNPETNFYRPCTSGNCTDQSAIQLAYLAVTEQVNSSLQGKTVLQVDTPHKNHSFLIVTKLTQEEIDSLTRNEFGRVDILAIFESDKDAILVDPWSMALFHHPQPGLHYKVYSSIDTTLDKASDLSFINITATCQIGKPETMKMYYSTPVLDSLNQPILNDKKEEMLQEVKYEYRMKNFADKIDALRNDPRWEQHCEKIESRPARKEAIRDFFEYKSINKYQSLQAYRPVRQDVNKVDKAGRTPIYYAAEAGDLNLVEKLINAGADLTQLDLQNWTPIMVAADAGHVNIVDVIHKRYASISPSHDKNIEYLDAAYLAAGNGHYDVVNYLLENGGVALESLFNKVTSDDFSKQQLHAIQFLYKYASDKEIEDKITFLHHAADNGQLEVIEALLKSGAEINVNNPDTHGHPPIDYAVANGYLDVVEALYNYNNSGYDVDDKNILLRMAVKNDHVSIAKFFIKNGADPNAVDADGYSPMYYAVKKGYLEVVKLLIKNGADVNQSNNDVSLLRLAVRKGHFDTVDLLLKELLKLANNAITDSKDKAHDARMIIAEVLTEKDDEKWTGLHSIAYGAPDALHELFKLIQVEPGDQALLSAITTALTEKEPGGKKTGLHMIASDAPDALPELFKLTQVEPGGPALLSAITNALTKIDGENKTGLHHIALCNTPDALPELFKLTHHETYGPALLSAIATALIAKDIDDCTGLHAIATQASGALPGLFGLANSSPEGKKIQEAIVEEMHMGDWERNNLLVAAVSSGHVEIFDLLLKNGADPTIEIEDENTLFDDAVENNHFDIARKIIDYQLNNYNRDYEKLYKKAGSEVRVRLEELNTELLNKLELVSNHVPGLENSQSKDNDYVYLICDGYNHLQDALNELDKISIVLTQNKAAQRVSQSTNNIIGKLNIPHTVMQESLAQNKDTNKNSENNENIPNKTKELDDRDKLKIKEQDNNTDQEGIKPNFHH